MHAAIGNKILGAFKRIITYVETWPITLPLLSFKQYSFSFFPLTYLNERIGKFRLILESTHCMSQYVCLSYMLSYSVAEHLCIWLNLVYLSFFLQEIFNCSSF